MLAKEVKTAPLFSHFFVFFFWRKDPSNLRLLLFDPAFRFLENSNSGFLQYFNTVAISNFGLHVPFLHFCMKDILRFLNACDLLCNDEYIFKQLCLCRG